MKILKEFFIIILFTLIGELIAYFLPFSFPGTIIGLILLFLALILKIVKVEDVKKVSNWLQNNMAFMFVPLAVGIMEHFEIIKINWLEILLVLFIPTTITLILTALITERGVKNE